MLDLDPGLNDAAAIITAIDELEARALKPEPIGDGIDGLYGITTRGGHQLIDLESYLDAPRAKRGARQFEETTALAWYVNTHRTAGTTLYANADQVSVLAVLDDHSKEAAGHQQHIATLKLRRTPGALRWLNAHGRYLEQTDFAQLVEDGITEIARPDGAELLEVAQSIMATKSAEFRSDRRLATGRVQFQWHEQLDASAGQNGDLSIPELLTLVFPPFYGADPVTIDARFRYRLEHGKLKLGVWLVRVEETMRDAFATEIERLRGMLETEDGEPGILAVS